LALARRGQAFDKPLYDLATHRRLAQVERIARAEALIVEGLHLLADAALRAAFDFSVYVEADEALRLGRRMVRDIESRGRTPRSVMMQFFATVRPMHEAHVAPQRALADLVVVSSALAGAEGPNEAVASIVARMNAAP
jgi:uridine kinase